METSNLDGEKNLKPRIIPKELTEEYLILENSSVSWQGRIECKAPSPFFHLFNGTLYIENSATILLNIKNLLFRGAGL